MRPVGLVGGIALALPASGWLHQRIDDPHTTPAEAGMEIFGEQQPGTTLSGHVEHQCIPAGLVEQLIAPLHS